MDAVQNLDNQNLKPQVRRFFSITQYLQSYYDYRKSLNSKFSYEIWSLELDFKSKSTLRMITTGRRPVTPLLIETFCHKEKFSEEEEQYFILLTNLQKSKKTSMKKIYLDKLAELSDFNYKTTQIRNALEFLSSPELCIIQIIASAEDFSATKSNLKSALDISSLKIDQSLQKLKDLHLLEEITSEKNKESIWKSKSKFFTVIDELQDEAQKMYHLSTVQELPQVINADILDKKIKTLLLSLGEDDYKDFANTVDQFTNKIKAKYANNLITNKKVYKVNVQVYPVTETVK